MNIPLEALPPRESQVQALFHDFRLSYAYEVLREQTRVLKHLYPLAYLQPHFQSVVIRELGLLHLRHRGKLDGMMTKRDLGLQYRTHFYPGFAENFRYGPFGSDSMKPIHMFDGLKMESIKGHHGLIRGHFYEFEESGQWRSLNSYRGFLSQSRDLSGRGTFADTCLTFVVCHDTQLPSPLRFNRSVARVTNVVSLPFTKEEAGANFQMEDFRS